MMRLDSRISHSEGSLSWQLARRVRWKGTSTALSTSTAGALQVYLRRRRHEHMLTGSHRDGLAGITERHPDLNVYDESPSDHAQLELSTRSGIDVALDLLKSEPERSITYIALGPLTNLGRMVRMDSDTVRNRIGRVVCMGGALDVPGNTSPVAECKYTPGLSSTHIQRDRADLRL